MYGMHMSHVALINTRQNTIIDARPPATLLHYTHSKATDQILDGVSKHTIYIKAYMLQQREYSPACRQKTKLFLQSTIYWYCTIRKALWGEPEQASRHLLSKTRGKNS